MRKKLTLALVLLCILTLAFSLAACGDKETPPPAAKAKANVVFIGDSIAEGIFGASPLTERESYAYFSVLGQRNDFLYYDRAVGGHTTTNLLDMVTRPDEESNYLQARLRKADVIVISITGNDFLLDNLGGLLLDYAKNNLVTRINGKLDTAESNLYSIFDNIYTMNPDATVMIQTIYNPFYEASTLLSGEERQALIDYDSKYATFSNMRELGSQFLTKFNTMIENIAAEYNADEDKDIKIIDVFERFMDIHDADAAEGESLIYVDWVHPSIKGHAVIADLIQEKLEALGIADNASAVANYKTMRCEQLDRLYGGTDLDVAAAKAAVNAASTCADVTAAYFEAIEFGEVDATVPDYIGNQKANTQSVRRFVSEDVTYMMDLAQTKIWGIVTSPILEAAGSSITLRTDGTITVRLAVNSGIIATLEDTLDLDLASMLAGLNLISLNPTADKFMPGFDFTDLEGTLDILSEGIGLSLTKNGQPIDTASEAFTAFQSDISADGIIDNLPDLTGIGVEYNGEYTLATMTDSDGVEHTAVYLGHYDVDSEPLFMMFLSEEDDKAKLNFYIPIAKTTVIGYAD